jgi:putative ABC transport system permease protein
MMHGMISWIRALGRGVRALFLPKRERAELDDELRFHIEMAAEGHMRRGLDREAALREARREFGGVDQVKETIRGRRRLVWIEDALRDVSTAFRSVRQRPGFSALVVVTLGVGIGANTAVFSLVNAVLLQPLPNQDGDRLVHVVQSAPGQNLPEVSFSVQEVEAYRARSRTLESVVEFHAMTFNLIGEGEPEEVQTGVVSWNYFTAMGMEPVLGRGFTPDEEAGIGPRVLVFSHEYWTQRFGRDPSVVGRQFEMNDQVHTVVGILPPAARFPAGPEVYMPVSHCPVRSSEAFETNPNARMMTVTGRMVPGMTLDDVAVEMVGIADELAAARPDVYRPEQTGYTASAVTVKEELVREARPTLLVLMAATLFVLLIACANVANLMLTRLDRRVQEMSVRTALGAQRGRLVRQLATESFVLAGLGAGVGLLITLGGLELLASFAARFTPRAAEIGIDLPVLGFTLAAATLTGLLFGVLPALARGHEPARALREAGVRSATRKSQAVRSVLVVAQIAASFVLLTGAGLLTRSFVALQSVDAGFDPADVLTARVAYPIQGRYSSWEAQDELWSTVLGELERAPGVEAVAVVNLVPLAGGGTFSQQVQIEGRPADDGQNIQVFQRVVTDGAFEALGIPLLGGRLFGPEDVRGGTRVALVNRTFAESRFEGEDPVGQRLLSCNASGCDPENVFTIVGVVGDVRFRGLDQEAGAEVYTSARQGGFYGTTLVLRGGSGALPSPRVVSEIIHRLDPELPVEDVRTLEAVRGEALAPRRLTLSLMGIFAGTALIVTLVGVFGLMAFVVADRRREIAIRMVFGAEPGSVVGMITRQAGVLIAAGLALGLVASPLLARTLEALLWGVDATDAPTLVGSMALLAAAALAACWIPARRAVAVSPATPLRSD